MSTSSRAVARSPLVGSTADVLDAEAEDPATQCKADDFASGDDGGPDQAVIGEAIARIAKEESVSVLFD